MGPGPDDARGVTVAVTGSERGPDGVLESTVETTIATPSTDSAKKR